jgi:hypothetical protein
MPSEGKLIPCIPIRPAWDELFAPTHAGHISNTSNQSRGILHQSDRAGVKPANQSQPKSPLAMNLAAALPIWAAVTFLVIAKYTC